MTGSSRGWLSRTVPMAFTGLVTAGMLAMAGGSAAAEQSQEGPGTQDHAVWCEYEVSVHDLVVFDQPSSHAHQQYVLYHGNVVMVREPYDGEDTTWRDLNYSLEIPQWARDSGLEKIPEGECVQR